MTMQQCPTLAAMVVQHRHQDLRREAQRVHAARVAASADNERKGWPWTQLRALAARMPAGSVHRLSAAARWVEIRLPARRATPSGA